MRVALKRTTKAGDYVSREYEVLEMLKDCDNCVKVLDIFYTKNDKGKMAQNLVFEFCSTNLETVIQDHKKNGTHLSMDEVRDIVKQILTGLVYVHDRGIVHRDLKPENVLMTEDNVVKICDFGSAKVIDSSGKNTPYIVSRFYRAPELILGVSSYGAPIDIWATGCIFAELLTQKPIFPGKSEGSQLLEQMAVLGNIKDSDLQGMSPNIPDGAKKLLKDVGKMDKKKIYDLLPKDIYDKDELKQAASLIENMLKWNPNKRPTANECLEHAFMTN